ncbi:hypothetical protein ACFVWR_08415 [Leifsonia sp. NPDC058292]|uniref:hypothetical protein n=1 Tax=Leifsonia sp. NPDC058292 TaxID=3346428 RepID=UPI0036DE41E0
MTHRISSFVTAFALGALLILFAALHGATSASALSSNGHGVGYTSSSGWYLGSYSLDDGSRAFCLQAGRPSPIGHESDYVDGAALGWYTPDQSAQLAYISRTWAATDDRVTAAAGQLATWMVSGMNGQSPEFYAARAGADGDAVLARARSMAAEAAREGSRDATATITVDLAQPGAATVLVDLTVDKISGPSLLAPAEHTGRIELVDAAFADGSTSTIAPNGTALPITPTGTDPTVTVSATSAFDGLPYGDSIRVAVARDDAQALLVAIPATTSARAEGGDTGVSPLPFQPRVSTVTSAAEATAGATISDHLTVDVEPGDGRLDTWGVLADGDAVTPIEAIVESTLLGPFATEITPAPTAPDDAPVVCTVEVTVTGPGEYETPGCVLPGPGAYVWVEKIDPARTGDDLGGDRMLPWRSPFGVASEITLVAAPPASPAPPNDATPKPASLASTGTDVNGAVLAGAGVLGAGTALLGFSRGRRLKKHRAARADR